MNVNLIHHWLVSMRGGEKVLEQFCRLFPDADIHTLVAEKNGDALSETLKSHTIKPTRLNRIPGGLSHYKKLLPLHPAIIKRHRVEADFVLSSDAGLVKGMKIKDDIPHVCYCHSPPRYLWDMQQDYLDSMGGMSRRLFEKLTPYIRSFDLSGASRVDHFIANSTFVQDRIKRVYGRDSDIIHPPVNLDAFEVSDVREDFYLVVAALVPYKKIDIAVDAFSNNGKKLIVIGAGSELENLKKRAKENIIFLGSQPDDILIDHYKRCKAFIFPGVEDFGITPLEAQASGKPVIALKKGGALETVIEDETGLFFDHQTAESLAKTVEEFERREDRFTPEACRKNAERFSEERFRNEIKQFLIQKYPELFGDYSWPE